MRSTVDPTVLGFVASNALMVRCFRIDGLSVHNAQALSSMDRSPPTTALTAADLGTTGVTFSL